MSVILDHLRNTMSGSGSGGVDIKSDGVTQVVITATGKLGVNNATPTYLVDINGPLRATDLIGTIGATVPAAGSFTGVASSGNLTVSGISGLGSTLNTGNGASTGDVSFEHGVTRSGDGNSIFDFHSTVGTDYDARLIRAAAINGPFSILNTGTGVFSIIQTGAGILSFATTNIERFRIDAVGDITATGNFGLTGSGKRFTGDFSGGTIANRALFKTSTVNGSTTVGAIPDGSGTFSQFVSFSSVNPDNSSYLLLASSVSYSAIESGKTGAGSYQPLLFNVGGAERFRLGILGQFGLSGTNYGFSGQMLISGGASASPSWTTPVVSTDIQNGNFITLSSVSGADTITASATPAITAYTLGQTFRFVSTGPNSTASTLNINGVGAVSIKKASTSGLVTLVANDIPSAGTVLQVTYDGSAFQMIAGAGSGSSGGSGAAGGGLDKTFLENDVFVTSNYTIGDSSLLPATVSITSPAIVTMTNNYVAGQPIRFTTTGALPTGLVTTAQYFVSATGLSSSAFRVSATLGGALINTTGTQSGTHKIAQIKNAGTFGPININDGITITVPTGTVWTIQ